MKATVLGAGAWGTSLAIHLARSGNAVRLWGHDREHLLGLAKARSNQIYLPGIALPETIEIVPEFTAAIDGAEMIVLAVPSKAFRELTVSLTGFAGLLVTVTKGIEDKTGLTMSGILNANTPAARIVALSGPSLALEVSRGIPTAIVAASRDEAAAQTVQRVFSQNTFRVYTSRDILGVEFGGAIKNVIAIAAGVCDGLGFGDNSKAALVTRAIVEIRRLGVACGAQAETFSGLSGLGDLTVTCFSKLSRNRGFGERLGRGESVETILSSSVSIAEGYPTARSACNLAQEKKVVTPIISEVYAMLYQRKDVRQAVHALMTRDPKQED